MSLRSGRTTSRDKVDSYKGFSIIKVKVTDWYKPFWSKYYTNIPDKVKIHYDFCKEGNETKPSQAYGCNSNNIAECKECIDRFIEDDALYFTSEEREKYVYKPNRKCKYAYGYDTLMRLMKQHQKADKRMKILLEDRLEDANFHSECGLLAEHDYEGFEELVTHNHKFREKFEIITNTEKKAIKDPKQFEDGLKKVIEDYFALQKVNNTEVVIKYIENW